MFGSWSLKSRARIAQLIAAVAFFSSWVYANGPGGVSPLTIPRIAKVGEEIWKVVNSNGFFGHLGVTMTEIVAAVLLASVSGLAVGFWGARTSLRAGVLEPVLVWGYLVPTVLFYPLLLLWLGFGMGSKIGYATISAFFPIAFNSLRGFARVDARYIRVGRAFGASPRQLDSMIKFRAGLPMAAAGLRVGIALTMITVIVAEMLGAQRGLGYLIMLYSQSYNTARTFAVIVIVLVLVGSLYAVVNRVLKEDAALALG